VAVGTPLRLSIFPRHREERSDVTIRILCGSCIPHQASLRSTDCHAGVHRLAMTVVVGTLL